MNVKSFVFDVGLPTVAVVGTGLLAYVLSGGVEEYPTAMSGDDELNTDFDQLARQNGSSENVSEQDQQILNESMDDSLEMLEKQSDMFMKSVADVKFQLETLSEANSNGFQKIMAKLEELSEEVKQLKANQNGTKYSCVTGVNDNCCVPDNSVSQQIQSTSPKQWSQADWSGVVHLVLACFVLQCEVDISEIVFAFFALQANPNTVEKSSNVSAALHTILHATTEEIRHALSIAATAPPSTTVTDGASVLLMYASNLLSHSAVPRYRKISTSNANYRSLVALKGYQAVLHVAGFAKKDSATMTYEWQWSAAALVAKQEKPSSCTDCGSVLPLPATEELALAVLREVVTLLQLARSGGDGSQEVVLKAREVLLQRLQSREEAGSAAEVSADSNDFKAQNQAQAAGSDRIGSEGVELDLSAVSCDAAPSGGRGGGMGGGLTASAPKAPTRMGIDEIFHKVRTAKDSSSAKDATAPSVDAAAMVDTASF